MFLAIGGLIALIMAITRYCWHRFHPKLQKFIIVIKAKLMYNSVIRYILQSFFSVSLGAMLNLRFTIFLEPNALNLITSLLVIALLIAFTIFSYTFM